MKRKIVGLFFLFTMSLAGVFIGAHVWTASPREELPNMLYDASRLNRTPIHTVIAPVTEEEVQKAITFASSRGLKIAIAGKRHSMGGQTLYPDALLLDMLSYNKILSLDQDSSVVTVQSGATWKDLQEYLNPRGAAVIAMQGPNIFTIGGSMSVNAHGWDIRHGPVAETIEWFRLALADGSIRRCSRFKNTELFHLVLGGYGLFGVILDVGIRVTPNSFYTTHDVVMDAREYPEYFLTQVQPDHDIDLAYADLSISPRSFLQELVAVSYTKDRSKPPGTVPLQEERHVLRDRFFFNLSRRYRWGKRLRWFLQQRLKDYLFDETLMTRNNLMRSPMRRLAYYSPHDTDILQEYFIPVRHFSSFVEVLRDTVNTHGVNLLNVTVRDIKPNRDAYLNYARTPMFAFVLYVNVKTSRSGQDATQAWTRQLIETAIELGGTFYLPYRPDYTNTQLTRAYPKIGAFFEKKRFYDPDQLFMNAFYAKYASAP